TTKKVEILRSYAEPKLRTKSKLLTVRFLVSPVELVGDETGHLIAMRLVKNRLVSSPVGTLQPKPAGEMEDLPVGLVFRSVGYKGVPLRAVPFHESWGVILNER